MRPNYFSFMGYLRKMIENQQSEPPYLYTYDPLSRNPGSATENSFTEIYMILIMPVTKFCKLFHSFTDQNTNYKIFIIIVSISTLKKLQ